MINSLFRGLVRSYLDSAIELLKIRAVMGYISGLKAFRRLVLVWCLLVFCLVLLAVGLGLIPLALCLFMPWAAGTKAIIAISFGAVYVIVPLVILLVAFSQKRWMKISGAANMMGNVLEKRQGRQAEESEDQLS